MTEYPEGVSRGVLIRDMLIFHVKLWMDGFKGVVLLQASLVIGLTDLVFGGRRRGRFFYKMLSAAERFDLWLNLYKPSRAAGSNADGLFGESRAGDDTLLGELEELVRRGEEPAARPAGPVRMPSGLPRAR